MDKTINKGDVFLATCAIDSVRKIKVEVVTDKCYLIENCMTGKLDWILKKDLVFESTSHHNWYTIIERFPKDKPF